jgi:hypothetical protein
MNGRWRAAALGLAAMMMSACSRGGPTYTLYRNGVGQDTLRIHVATFDAGEPDDYNRENCEQTRELYQVSPAARSRFWCEQGRFKHKK